MVLIVSSFYRLNNKREKEEASQYHIAMDYKNILSSINESWLSKRVLLSKDEIRHMSDKDSFRGKIHGFLTRAYYKRKDLIVTGEIVYCLAFKSWSNDLSDNAIRYRSWVIFSTSTTLRSNPSLLKKISENILTLMHEENSDKAYSKLIRTLNEPLSDASYLELPKELCEGELAYLSIIYVEKNLNPNFSLGLNLLLVSPSVSQEVLYLPEGNYPHDFLEAYKAHKLDF